LAVGAAVPPISASGMTPQMASGEHERTDPLAGRPERRSSAPGCAKRDSIGAQRVDPAYTFCFEASSDTKRRVLEIADDLNRWVRGGTVSVTTPPLGERTELKRLLVAFVAAYLRESVDTILTNDAGLLTIQTNDSPHTRELRDLRPQLVEAVGAGFDHR